MKISIYAILGLAMLSGTTAFWNNAGSGEPEVDDVLEPGQQPPKSLLERMVLSSINTVAKAPQHFPQEVSLILIFVKIQNI